MFNYAHKMTVLYGENKLRKLVKRALGEHDDFLSYAVHARYNAHFEVSFAAQPCARKNYVLEFHKPERYRLLRDKLKPQKS